MEGVLTVLDDALREFSSHILVGDDYIPQNLLEALKWTATDASLRTVLGNSQDTWDAFARILSIGARQITRDSDGHLEKYLRYFNGLVLLGRNLVTTDKGAYLAYPMCAEEAAKIAAALFSRPVVAGHAAKLQLSLLQFLSNMGLGLTVGGSIPDVDGPFTLFISSLDDDGSRNVGRELYDERLSVSLMVLAEASSRVNPHAVATSLTESSHGLTFFGQLLNCAGSWFDGDTAADSQRARATNDLFKCLVMNQCAPKLLNLPATSVSGAQKVTLLKAVDGAVYSLFESNTQLSDADDIASVVYADLKQALGAARHPMEMAELEPEYGEEETEHIRTMHSRIVVDLDMLQTLLERAGPIAVNALLATDAVDTLILALVHADNHLPKESKLSKLPKDIEAYQPRPEVFPTVKSGLVSILTALTTGNAAVQNKMRELGGLATVLSNCIIDLNNPYIKERCILCVRHLLEGNAANQAFVAQLEAKEVVSDDALKEAGYETELVNGKLALKKTARS